MSEILKDLKAAQKVIEASDECCEIFVENGECSAIELFGAEANRVYKVLHLIPQLIETIEWMERRKVLLTREYKAGEASAQVYGQLHMVSRIIHKLGLDK